jgi:hypothetical protein
MDTMAPEVREGFAAAARERQERRETFKRFSNARYGGSGQAGVHCGVVIRGSLRNAKFSCKAAAPMVPMGSPGSPQDVPR